MKKNEQSPEARGTHIMGLSEGNERGERSRKNI